MDSLHIKALKVSTKVGVHAWEQRISQSLLIDLTIAMDFSACPDNLANTLDYDLLCQTVTEFVQSKSFQLIESVANSVVALIQQEFKVKQITVAVSKPHAIKNAELVQVIACR
jgi:dihydroneopterin aldolase